MTRFLCPCHMRSHWHGYNLLFYTLRTPDGFPSPELLRPRDVLFIARETQRHSIEALAAETPHLTRLSGQALRAQVPILDTNVITAGLLDTSGGDLDVAALVQGFLAQLRANGGTATTQAGIQAIRAIPVRAGRDDELLQFRLCDVGTHHRSPARTLLRSGTARPPVRTARDVTRVQPTGRRASLSGRHWTHPRHTPPQVGPAGCPGLLSELRPESGRLD